MAIKIGIAPDSWGVWFPQHEKQPPWDRCLNEMQAAGYDGDISLEMEDMTMSVGAGIHTSVDALRQTISR